MQKITVNSNNVYEVDFKKDKPLINNKVYEWDLVEIKQNIYHIIKDGRSYNAEILKADLVNKEFTILINGNKYQVKAEDEFDLLLEKMGMNKTVKNLSTQLKAPMPGLIIEIKVVEGQEIKKGDTLLILEAMKMENVLKAPSDGIIKTIKAEKGKTVEKDQVLITF